MSVLLSVVTPVLYITEENRTITRMSVLLSVVPPVLLTTVRAVTTANNCDLRQYQPEARRLYYCSPPFKENEPSASTVRLDSLCPVKREEVQ